MVKVFSLIIGILFAISVVGFGQQAPPVAKTSAKKGKVINKESAVETVETKKLNSNAKRLSKPITAKSEKK